ncbi:MAG TPA: class I SAM-dependent RNA methyltransferase [Thermomicrobiales bacterium]|nr:class I SAM-dependent RNA methyltransferase [Thermomicrobiales bacterium]
MKQRAAGYELGERLDVSVERIVPGGEGLARGPKGVVLVEHAAPGDTLAIEIEALRGGAARGRIKQIVEPGPSRIEPPCPWYGRCGGCDFQHLSYRAQLDAKETIVRDALHRIGRIDWDGRIEQFSAPHPFGSRSRVEFHTDPQSGAVGFFARRSNEIVPIDHCLVCHPEIDAALQTIRASSDRLPPAIHLLAGDGRTAVSPALPLLADGPLWLTIGEIDYLVDPAGFFQSSFDLLPALIDYVLDSSGAERRLVWDLFSGAGLFSLPLARLFDDVVGVEVDADATEHAAHSARRNGIGNARFDTGDVARWIAARPQRSVDPDLIVVDPPRAGLGVELSTRLAAKRPRRITYVSCDPTTLARDLRLLTEGNLGIRQIAIFDLFPQTHHVETVVQLVDGSRS